MPRTLLKIAPFCSVYCHCLYVTRRRGWSLMVSGWNFVWSRWGRGLWPHRGMCQQREAYWILWLGTGLCTSPGMGMKSSNIICIECWWAINPQNQEVHKGRKHPEWETSFLTLPGSVFLLYNIIYILKAWEEEVGMRLCLLQICLFCHSLTLVSPK